MPARSTAEMCTNASGWPSSRWMKPKPFIALKNLTVPVAGARTTIAEAAFTRFAGSALGHRHRLAVDLQLGRRDATTAVDQREAERLAFGKRAKARLLDRRDVDEHVFAAVITDDEAEALLRVEELDHAGAFADDLRGHAAATAAEAATTAAAAETTAAAAEAATVAAAEAAATEATTAEAATITAAKAAATEAAAAVAAAATEIVAAETVALVATTSATIAAATFVVTHNPIRLPGSPASNPSKNPCAGRRTRASGRQTYCALGAAIAHITSPREQIRRILGASRADTCPLWPPQHVYRCGAHVSRCFGDTMLIVEPRRGAA